MNAITTLNPSLWLTRRDDESIIVTDGKISTWQDVSGNGEHFTVVASNRPGPVERGVRFVNTVDGSWDINRQYLQRLSTSLMQSPQFPFTVWVVVSDVNNEGHGTIISGTNPETQWNRITHKQLQSRRSGFATLNFSSADLIENRICVESRWLSSSDRRARVFDDKDDGTELTSTESNAGPDHDRCYIGATRPGSSFFPPDSLNGIIHEIIIVPGNPTDEQRAAVRKNIVDAWYQFIPTTPDEIWRASFNQASGNPAYESVIVREIDAQRLANHNASLWAGRLEQWKGRPKWYSVLIKDVAHGDFPKTSPGQFIKITKPGTALKNGKWLVIMGRRPHGETGAELTCMGWNYYD